MDFPLMWAWHKYVPASSRFTFSMWSVLSGSRRTRSPAEERNTSERQQEMEKGKGTSGSYKLVGNLSVCLSNFVKSHCWKYSCTYKKCFYSYTHFLHYDTFRCVRANVFHMHTKGDIQLQDVKLFLNSILQAQIIHDPYLLPKRQRQTH